MSSARRILVAPLHWGLGHATRCVPLIRTLQDQGHQLFLASDGRALDVLRAAFPTLPAYDLPAYDVTYRSSNMFWNIGWQLPKIAWAIKSEQERIEQLVSQNNIDTVISDNRFGAHSSRTRNIFLTHQLHLKIPFRPFSRIANWCNHYFIRRFDELWIPDFADVENSLAGSLSHPPLPQITTHYLGALSRFSTSVVQENTASQYDLFVLMSGPEPQRTFLEEQLIEQIRASGLTAIVAQGKTERRESYTLGRRIKVVNYLSAKEISATAAVSKFMVCRSGYSTIMDLYRLQKNAILIPTPGQTEQEYLADVLRREGIFYSMSQRAFDLKTALSNAKNFTGFRRRMDSRRYTRWSELL